MSGVRIDCVEVRKRFGSATAVDGFTFVVESGRRVGVAGESGSGKSTVGRMIVGLERPTSGTIAVDGVDVQELLSTRAGTLSYRRAVQLVAQDTTSTFDPRHRVGESIAVPAQVLGGLDRPAALEAVDGIAGELNIPLELLQRYPGELSGGQRQRLSLARALVVRPSLIVCDEVVSALDVSVQGTVLNLLKRYAIEHGSGLLFIAHGLPATAFVTEELVVMRHGRVVEAGRTREVLAEPRHEYTRSLVEAYRGEAAA